MYRVAGNMRAPDYFNVSYNAAGAVVRVKSDLRGDRKNYFQVSLMIVRVKSDLRGDRKNYFQVSLIIVRV